MRSYVFCSCFVSSISIHIYTVGAQISHIQEFLCLRNLAFTKRGLVKIGTQISPAPFWIGIQQFLQLRSPAFTERALVKIGAQISPAPFWIGIQDFYDCVVPLSQKEHWWKSGPRFHQRPFGLTSRSFVLRRNWRSRVFVLRRNCTQRSLELLLGTAALSLRHSTSWRALLN